MRALRALPRVLSDVLRARHRDGLAARRHLPDQVARRGPHRPHRFDRRAPSRLCLDCRACETVCPAGVPYGQLIEAAKRRDRAPAPGRRRCGALFRWLNFGAAARHARACCALAAARPALLPGERAAALVRAERASLRLLPGTLPAWEALLPTLPPAPTGRRCPRVTPPRAPGAARVGAADRAASSRSSSAPHNRATARVLATNGCEVVAPARAGLLRRAARARRASTRSALDAGPAHHRGVRGGAASTRSSSTRRAAART